MDVISALQAVPWLGPYLPTIFALAGVCAAISMLLPPPKVSGGVYFWFYTVVNWIGLNLGHARNATAPVGVPKPPVAAIAILLLGTLVLSACKSNPDGTTSLSPQAQADIQTLCQRDAQLQPLLMADAPVIAALASMFGVAVPAALGTATVFDQTLVHPFVQDLCAKLQKTAPLPTVTTMRRIDWTAVALAT